jgi:ribosome-binding factor A
MFNDEIVKAKPQKTNSKRPLMVAKEVKHIINDLFIKSQIKDKDLFDKTILISEVIVSSDLSYAKIYVLPMLNEDFSVFLAALNRNSSFFKHQIGQKLHIRNVPKPIFLEDDTLDRIEKTNEMFKKIAK